MALGRAPWSLQICTAGLGRDLLISWKGSWTRTRKWTPGQPGAYCAKQIAFVTFFEASISYHNVELAAQSLREDWAGSALCVMRLLRPPGQSSSG